MCYYIKCGSSATKGVRGKYKGGQKLGALGTRRHWGGAWLFL